MTRENRAAGRQSPALVRYAAGTDAALAEGVKISREMLVAVAERVQGVQVSAPLGKVPVALEVIEATPIEPVSSRGYKPGT